MKMLKVRYLGTKKNRRIQLPYPFLALGEAAGEVTFEGPGSVMEVDAENAKRMAASDHGLFELVQEEKVEEKAPETGSDKPAPSKKKKKKKAKKAKPAGQAAESEEESDDAEEGDEEDSEEEPESSESGS